MYNKHTKNSAISVYGASITVASSFAGVITLDWLEAMVHYANFWNRKSIVLENGVVCFSLPIMIDCVTTETKI